MTDALRLYFEDHADTWDSRMPDNLADALRGLAASFAAEISGAGTILEIGTGTGAFIPMLRQHAPSALLVSVDLANAMLRQARQRVPGARLAQADVHRLPAAGSSIDLAVCHNSFPHFIDKPSALREMGRVLRPGGRLLILHNLPRDMVNRIHTRAGAPIENDLLPPGDALRGLLLDAGYTAVHVEDLPERYTARAQRP